MAQPHKAKASYGIDGPIVPAAFSIGAIIFIICGLIWSPWFYIGAVLSAIQSGFYLHATFRGKFVVWDRVLNDIPFQGNEKILDMGCGHGTVLIAAAQHIPHGTATGIDLWRSIDQSGNSMDATLRNAEIEGVADRITLETADMTALPFPDNSFDVVVSSLAIHNIHSVEGRKKAVHEAYRVAKPGGHIIIADPFKAKEYGPALTEAGATDTHTGSVGWEMWWSGPWSATYFVTATKS